MIGIYKITNPKGKVYVGQTTNLHKRKINYQQRQCSQQRKIYNSILKYGWENHIFEILEECLEEKLNEREIHWGNIFNVTNPEKGLNLKEPGGAKGKHSDETKKLISQKNIGTLKPKSNEFREKRREIMKGNSYGAKPKHTEEFKNIFVKSLKGNKYHLGFVNSDETKQKMSLAKDNMKKKIYCPELNQTFESMSKASSDLKINLNCISSIINGRTTKTRSGLTFKVIR